MRRALAGAMIAIAGCSYGRDPGTVACSPGEVIDVGCAEACEVGMCQGDPVLRVCEGSSSVTECADAMAILGESDDACESVCPRVRLTCPASGRITVIHRAFDEGDSICEWEVRPVESP